MSFFFFNDTATTEIYTLSLHDALPIYVAATARICAKAPEAMVDDCLRSLGRDVVAFASRRHGRAARADRKSTRLNSSHANISYAVFCLKKKQPAAYVTH